MEDSANTELVRSHVDTIILRTLQNKDSYPYEILREIEELSSGKYVLKQATLYSCMKRLEKIGYINSYWGTESEGGRRRYYSLTELGKDFLNRDKEEWEFSRTLIDKLLSDKEVDLESVTPPFDASSLRPLTKRGQTKEGTVNVVDTAKIPSEPNIESNVVLFETKEANFADHSPENLEKCATETEKVSNNNSLNAESDSIDKKSTFFENLENSNVNENVGNAVYFSKEPIFQHTLPEEDQNSFQSESNYKASPNFYQKTEPRYEPVEETEDMKAAADLLHIGKKYRDADAFISESRSYPPHETKSMQSNDSQNNSENYRDILNRIFDTEITKTVSKSETENETVLPIEPAAVTQPLHGRHLKDLQTGLEKQGYALRIYNPKNRSDYYYNKYVYQNKINLATNLLMFLIMAVEFIVVASMNGILHFHAITLIISGICICVPLIAFFFVYLWNPTKRIRANYNFMQTFLYRSVLALILIAIEVIVCLLTPSFGIGFSDARMYLPWLFAIDIPLYAVLYDLLYRSKKFHLSCQKF